VDTVRTSDEAVRGGAVTSLRAARKIRISYPSVVAVSAACLLLLRGIPRLRVGALHLEDGQIYFSQAHNMGLAAILQTDRRYLVPFYRITAALLDLFPVTAAPVLYPLAALLVQVAMLTPALSARLEWIIPGRMLRAVLFALLCLMPGLWESLAIVTHSGNWPAICLLLLMLSDDPRSRAARVGELAAVAVMGLTGVQMVIFAPWFAWRWWRTRSRHSLAVLAVAVAQALVGGVVLLLSGSSPRGQGNLLALPRVWVERIGGTWLFGYSDLLNSPSRMVWLGVALAWCIGSVVITVVALRRTAVVLWLLFLAWLAAPVLAYGYMPPPRSFGRHFVIPIAIVIVLLVATIGAIGARRWAIAAVVCIALGVPAMLHDFAPQPYWPDPLRPICYFRPEVKFSAVNNFGSPKGCLPSVTPDLRDPRDPATWGKLYWSG
jgi:hypothetical protein